MRAEVLLGILGFAGVAFLGVFGFVLFSLVRRMRPKSKTRDVLAALKSGEKVSLAELNGYLETFNVSSSALSLIGDYFIANFKLPENFKAESKEPSHKPYATFLALFISQFKTDAKIISQFDAKLKKSSPDLKIEIEKLEAKYLSGGK